MTISAWYRTGTVNVQNGQDTITGVNTKFLTDVGAPYAGDEFTVDNQTGYEVVEILSETSLRLDRPYEGATDTSLSYGIKKLSSRSELARGAADISRVVAQKQQTLDQVDNWSKTTDPTADFTDRHGNVVNVKSLNQALVDAQSALTTANDATNGIQAMRQVAAGAVKQALNASMGGMSGFVEWGKSYDVNISEVVNEGIWVYDTPQSSITNTIFLGNNSGNYEVGTSISNVPVLKVDNSLIELFNVGTNNPAFNCAIKFPEAPNGLQKADGTGEFNDLAQAITAGGTDLSASVINRTDLVILEVWDELIATKDLVVPYGNVHFEPTTYEGIALVNYITTLGVGQGYAAMYEGDTTSRGRGIRWSTATDEQKEIFLSDSKNNIRNTPDGLVQRRYRIRTIAGLEGDWGNPELTASDLRHSDGNGYVIPQGSSDVAKGLGAYTLGTSYKGSQSNYFEDYYGCWNAVSSSFTDAYKGFCVAMPIALVERLNKGAYHPVYNENGCATWWTADGTTSSSRKWYFTDYIPSGVSDCFDFLTQSSGGTGRSSTWGYIAGGNSGHKAGLFYDAIYADQVRDLRIDASRNWDLQRISDYVYQGCANGDFSERETEYLPYTGRPNVGLRYYITHGARPNEIAIYDNGQASDVMSIYGSIKNFDKTFANGTTVYIYILGQMRTAQTNGLQSQNYVWLDNFSPALDTTGLDGTYSGGASDAFIIGTEHEPIYELTNIKSKYWTDVVCNDVSVLAAKFPNGFYGSWIPKVVNTSGTIFDYNRKVIGSSTSATYSADGGATWATGSDGASTANQTSLWDMSVYDIILWTYEYAPKFTSSANQVRKDFCNDIVFSSNSYDRGSGNTMIQSLFDKVPTNANSHPYSVDGISMYGYFIDNNIGGKFATHASYIPQHDTINLASVDSPAGKYFIYLHINDYNIVEAYAVGKELVFDSGADSATDATIINAGVAFSSLNVGDLVQLKGFNNSQLNGKYYEIRNTVTGTTWSASVIDGYYIDANGVARGDTGVQWALQPWDGNGFGDDNKFNIVDGESYITDYNGNTVKVLCHKIKMPFPIYLPRTIKESN